jgi:hypothetical protein
MVYREGSHESIQPADRHDPWVSMQTAYLEYRSASEVLERTHQSTEDSSEFGRLQMILLEGRQRAAFERYLHARMELLECRLDDSHCLEPEYSGLRAPSRGRSPLAIAGSRSVLEVLAVVLLCTTAFSLARELRHVRDLETTQVELRSKLQETREALRTVKQRLDDWKPSQRVIVMPRIDHAPRTPAPKPRIVAHAPTGRQTPLNTQRKSTGNEKNERRPNENPGRRNQMYFAGQAQYPSAPMALWPLRSR